MKKKKGMNYHIEFLKIYESIDTLKKKIKTAREGKVLLYRKMSTNKCLSQLEIEKTPPFSNYYLKIIKLDSGKTTNGR